MRLTDYEQIVIKKVIAQVDPDARVWLFGSRVDDRARGGDIDLLVMSNTLSMSDKTRIRLALYEQLGEQKIDIVVAADDSDPFIRIALAKGILL